MRLHVTSALGVAALLICGLVPVAISSETPRAAVVERQATMQAAKSALEPLVAMVAMRRHFDRSAARSARAKLIKAMRRVPKRFEQPVTDMPSKAREAIWTNRDDFRTHAEDARDAARAVRTRSLPALRQSLPDVITACLNCHDTYRMPD